MGKYVIRRLLQMIPVFIGVTFIIYAAVFALGDPTVGRCGNGPARPGTSRRSARSTTSTSR